MIPWFWAAAAVFGVAGLWISFFVAPTDAQQGEGYRIIFVHVPASWMSMFIYLVMAFWAGAWAGAQYPRVGHDGAGPGAHRRADGGPVAAGQAPSGASRCGAPGGYGTRA
jgi:hypothetical protein